MNSRIGPRFFGERSESAQHFRRCPDRFFDVRRAVCRGDKTRLELRGRQVNSFREHAVEIFFEPLAVTLYGTGKIPDRTFHEISAEHRAASG